MTINLKKEVTQSSAISTSFSQTRLINTGSTKSESNGLAKKPTDNDSKAKRNLTLMIVSISFLFTIGTLPWAIYYTLSSLVSIPNLYPMQVLASCCLYLLVSLKIFVYYFFNRLFRQILTARLHFVTNLLFC